MLHEICQGCPIAFQSALYTGYRIGNAGEKHTILHYRIPFTPEDEAIMMERYAIKDRRAFYKEFAKSILNQNKVTNYLVQNQVAGVLPILQAEQHTDPAGITHIYIKTEDVVPITESLLRDRISTLSLLEAICRLATTLRDLHRLSTPVVHRGLDIREVWFSSRQKILLAGFYYANSAVTKEIPNYLPQKPHNIPTALLEGNVGDVGSDMQMLSAMAWNLFSGTPPGAEICEPPYIFPEYATEELASILTLGLGGRAEDFSAFRKGLADCRKMIKNAPELAEQMIPIRQLLEPVYEIGYTGS